MPYSEHADARHGPSDLLPADTQRNRPARICCRASTSGWTRPSASSQLACSGFDLHVAFFKFQCAWSSVTGHRGRGNPYRIV